MINISGRVERITAIVPVRAGSKRLKNKNIAPFAGTNLLLYKIAQLKQVPEVDRIVVSSDSDVMLQMAHDAVTETHRRAPEYCDEHSKSFGEVVRHIAENVEGEHILWATCTSPLVEPPLYTAAIQKYKEVLEGGKYDSLASFEIVKRYLWDENGPLNYKLGKMHVPSQELPNLYVVSDGIFLAPREKMIEWYYVFGKNPYRFIIDKRSAVDIDDGLDLATAKAWLNMD